MKTLIATKRSKANKLEDVRASGMIPAVVYGASVENTPISVSSIDFVKAWKEVGESSTIVVDIEGKKVDALIHDVQFDPVKSYPLHADFLAVDMNKPVHVSVPLEFTGVAPAEKSGLGTLVKVMHEVEIKALPKDLPHAITVDISALTELGSQVHAKDMSLPSGVTLLTDAEEVIALIAAQKEEKEEEVAPVDLSAIEVEKKGKKEEEGAEGGEEKN
jgi:large subunit ribosomal protein L25